MIAYLKGRIKYLALNWLILDVNGIGYKIYLKTENSKLKIDEILELFIYNHIREDRQELYGFLKMEELQMFELLISVNGVGPKMAMNILSQVGSDKLKSAIINGDSMIFTTISGVGKKIAAKIIIELKNKIGGLDDINLNQVMGGDNDLTDALCSLGYSKSEIFAFIKEIPENAKTTEEKVKWVLKKVKQPSTN